jgi:CBS domain-containing protein
MRPSIENAEAAKALADNQDVASVLERKGRAVFFIHRTATVYDAVALMAQAQVGSLLVMDDGRLEGIVSERDYARKVILQGKSSRSTLVEEIMSRPVITVQSSTSVKDCLQIITDQRIRHLPVVDPDSGAVEGVVSVGDLVRTLVQSQAETVEQLTNYIKGKYPG